MTPSRIVCAVDFTANGRAVLARAVALADWHDAELDVLYVRPGGRTRTQQADEGLRAHLVEFVRQSAPATLRAATFVHAGDPVTSTVSHVADRPADLVVVGQDGPRRALYWSRGRFAAAVARRVPAPVITVTDRAPHTSAEAQFRRIVCAVDTSRAAAGALDAALALAQRSRGHLTVLHVVERFPNEPVYTASSVSRLLEEFDAEARDITGRLRQLVPADALHWCDVDYRVLPGTVPGTIVSVASAEAADLLVVGSPPRSWFGAIGSTVAGVLARATSAVLTVPGPSGVRQEATPRRGDVVDLAHFRALHVGAYAPVRDEGDGGGTLWTT